jgi:Ser-tRNA(Ala) deacylase AlaX
MERATDTQESNVQSSAQVNTGKEDKTVTTEASHNLMATLNELVKEELQMIDDWVFSAELEEKLAVASQKSTSGNEDSKSENWEEVVYSKSEDKDTLIASKSRSKKCKRMEILE